VTASEVPPPPAPQTDRASIVAAFRETTEALTKSMEVNKQLVDAVVSQTKTDRRWNRFGAALLAVAVAAILTLSATSWLRGANTSSAVSRIDDCTTVGGTCYELQQERFAQFIEEVKSATQEGSRQGTVELVEVVNAALCSVEPNPCVDGRYPGL